MAAQHHPLKGEFRFEPGSTWDHTVTLYEDGVKADLTNFVSFAMQVRAHRRNGALLATAACSIVAFSAPDTYNNEVRMVVDADDISNDWPARVHYDLEGTRGDGTIVRWLYGPGERGPLNCTLV